MKKNKLKPKLNSRENIEYWNFIIKTGKEIEKWPEYKKALKFIFEEEIENVDL